MSETTLWNWLKKARQIGPILHICRIENIVISGMPDVELCFAGYQVWLELKVYNKPKRASTPIKIRFQPNQIPWIKNRTKAKGCAFVLLQIGKYPNRDFCVLNAKKLEVMKTGLPIADLKTYADLYIEEKISAINLLKKIVKLCIKLKAENNE